MCPQSDVQVGMPRGMGLWSQLRSCLLFHDLTSYHHIILALCKIQVSIKANFPVLFNCEIILITLARCLSKSSAAPSPLHVKQRCEYTLVVSESQLRACFPGSTIPQLSVYSNHSLWVLVPFIFYIVYVTHKHILLCDGSIVTSNYSLNLILFNFYTSTSCLSMRIINNRNAAVICSFI